MQENAAFLEVDESISGQKWVQRLDSAGLNRAEAVADNLQINEILARILVGRGVSIEDAEDYLSSTIRSLMPDPSTLTDMDAAAERLARAVATKERVAIFGDYDVDGATSSALMSRFLTHFGNFATTFLEYGRLGPTNVVKRNVPFLVRTEIKKRLQEFSTTFRWG